MMKKESMMRKKCYSKGNSGVLFCLTQFSWQKCRRKTRKMKAKRLGGNGMAGESKKQWGWIWLIYGIHIEEIFMKPSII